MAQKQIEIFQKFLYDNQDKELKWKDLFDGLEENLKPLSSQYMRTVMVVEGYLEEDNSQSETIFKISQRGIDVYEERVIRIKKETSKQRTDNWLRFRDVVSKPFSTVTTIITACAAVLAINTCNKELSNTQRATKQKDSLQLELKKYQDSAIYKNRTPPVKVEPKK